ncbi:MAG: hypothetical protein GY814_02910 [Gammaproteobacteria bacterium]|nr:hypothetical protein [Gammaproteobacteria bacterium]
MPKLTTEPTQAFIKMLFMGYSGEGKSSALVPLSIPDFHGNSGYELRWLDFDGKAEEVVRSTLARLLHSKKISKEQHDTALIENNDICSCIEPSTIITARENGKNVKKMGITSAVAWQTAVKQIEKWENSLNDKTILITDSFTYAARAITNFSQSMNNKLNQALDWRDYQVPQQLAETLMVTMADLPTHSIVCAHQDPLEIYKATDQVDDKGNPVEDLVDTLMVPISIGKAGRMKLPARFNHCLLATSEGKGAATRRWIYTEPRVGVVTKTPYFGRCEPRYPIEFGMVDYFNLRG